MGQLEDILKHQNKVQENIVKAFGYEVQKEDCVEKARVGVYADNAENRRLNRVGQPYGHKKQEEEKTPKEKKNVESNSSTSGKKSLQDYAKQTDDEKLNKVVNNKNAPEDVKQAAKKELEGRKKTSETNDEASRAYKTVTKMSEDPEFAAKFNTWNNGLYDEDEISSEDEAEFENMAKHVNYDFGEFFDWKDKDEAEDYQFKMQGKGFTVIDCGDGTDAYLFYIFKPKKRKR